MEATTEQKTSIAKKISEIIQEVQVVEKSQFNGFLKYAYSSKDDIFKVLRAEMSKRNLSYFPSIMSVDREEVGKKGETRFMIAIEISLVCGDTGEIRSQTWHAEAHTKDNLGIQQAMTQAIRFWAVNTFMLMDESHENYEETHEVKKEKTYENPRDSIEKALWDAQFSDDEISEFMHFVATNSKKDSIDDVSAAILSKWVPKIVGLDEKELREKVNQAIKTEKKDKK